MEQNSNHSITERPRQLKAQAAEGPEHRSPAVTPTAGCRGRGAWARGRGADRAPAWFPRGATPIPVSPSFPLYGFKVVAHPHSLTFYSYAGSQSRISDTPTYSELHQDDAGPRTWRAVVRVALECAHQRLSHPLEESSPHTRDRGLGHHGVKGLSVSGVAAAGTWQG